MSVPIYGRVTPLQADVLCIGGVLCGVPDDLVQEQDRIDGMRKARENLQKKTGQNFGYDLAKWHEFLLSSKEHNEEYTFHYAWSAVSTKVAELLHDPERLSLIAIVEEKKS